ncbi:hypothetical protein O181_087046 [Austropuccinia psidii MF-1]|uniref:Uncharacterized protein n=1 Tax=Austropuccinia psidii MF-1 TaxID=1389203 RepID=A0A9Q3INY0_9BASI|nr:hypothetical protein [Austropuccinia psidii MF-1]
MMIQIQEQKSQRNTAHRDWVTALPQEGDRRLDAFLFLVDRKNNSNSEDMFRRFCSHGLELKDSDGFTHYWCMLIPALELAHETSILSSTGKTPEMLEKRLEPTTTL